MRDLAFAYRTALGDQHGADILAAALWTMELWHQVDWEHTLLTTEFVADPIEIDLLIKSTFKTEGMNAEAGIEHRADRRMPRWIKLLGQT